MSEDYINGVGGEKPTTLLQMGCLILLLVGMILFFAWLLYYASQHATR